MGHKFFTGVDGGLSGGSSVRRAGSEDPHQRQRKLAFESGLPEKLSSGVIKRVLGLQ